MKHLVIAAAAFVASLTVSAEIPEGYYRPIDGLSSPSELKTAVYNVINPHTVPQVSDMERYYYNSLPVFFQQTDTYPDSNRWWDMYSNMTFYAPSMSGLNREHSFPKSWWGGSTTIPPFVDLNHLYPSERAANMAKSNYPLGEVDMGEKVSFDNGVSKVGYPVAGQGGNASRVFEPADEYKGDFARTYFYMVTCYQTLTWAPKYSWMLQSNTYPTLAPWAQELLLDWSRQDPVSQKEIDRNEAVYRIQNNRNPFIDLPGLEEYIWGRNKNQKYVLPSSGPTTPTGKPQLFSPVAGMSLDFSEVAVGGSTRSLLLFNGENLTGSVSLVITGADRAMFSIDDRTIDTRLINADGGYYLPVTYRPTATGSHRANLTVFDVTGWGAGSINVELRGEALEVPSLRKINVLPASDVTSTSYVANWEVPQGDVVDYYIVTRTHRLPGGGQEIVSYDAEQNYCEITDYDPTLYDYYTVQSVRLGYRSPMSDPVYVGNAGLTGPGIDMPALEVIVTGQTVRFICGETLTGARFYDLAGRLVMTLPAIERNLEISFPGPGVYFVVTDRHPEPVKILIR